MHPGLLPPRLRAVAARGRVVSAVLAVAACVGDGGPPPTVVLLGDSIATEVAPYLADELEGEARLLERHFGGSAPCNWLDGDVAVEEADVVVISFIGNHATDCMAGPDGEPLRGTDLVARYAADLQEIIDRYGGAGADVLLAGQPRRAPDPSDPEQEREIDGLDGLYRRLAEADGVELVDAGAAVESDTGDFVPDLPCLDREPECGPSGNNPVRSDDGVHLCPGPPASPCPRYSSGAYRYAAALAAALRSSIDGI